MQYDPNDTDMWRFEEHTRPYWHKGKLTNGVGCPGQYRTFDEAWAIKQQLDATGKQFPD